MSQPAPSNDVLTQSRQCVMNAIHEVNGLRAKDAQIPTSGAVVLVGEGGLLDSLGLVNLACALDLELTRVFGPGVTVMGELLAAPDPSEFQTLELFLTFVAARVSSALS